jgi:hypothetical protein
MTLAIRLFAKNSPSDIDWKPLRDHRDTVQRLTVGSKSQQYPVTDLGKLNDALKDASGRYLFPNLQEIFLWRVSNIEEIPRIANLKTLDIRDADDLRRVEIPTGIERLIIERCPNLDTLSITSPMDSLRELSLSGCQGLGHEQVLEVLRNSPRLLTLDLSGIKNLQSLRDSIPKEYLERLSVRDCHELQNLRLSPRLEYADLRGCSALEDGGLFSQNAKYLKYLDLSLCRKIRNIKPLENRIRQGELQSLFLFGSGVLDPPSTEHGSELGQDVAQETTDFFRDKEFGTGESDRCKVLLLGNGSAGKTELAHRLCDIKRIDDSSTDNIQFWRVDDFPLGSQDDRKTQLHIWDFGGQEIYHSTHRLFVSAGSIFIIVWDPDEVLDPEQGCYSIRYWLDYIYSVSIGFSPFIAVVCNDKRAYRGKPRKPTSKEWLEQELKTKLSIQVGKDYFTDMLSGKIQLFCSDLRNDHSPHVQHASNDGDWPSLRGWVQETIKKLFDIEGSRIPLYWQYGQEMIRPLLPNAITDSQPQVTQGQPVKKPTLRFEEFREQLREFIQGKLGVVNSTNEALGEGWDNGAFLTEERTCRVLRYLTRTGYLYWDPKLHQQEVVVDQKWALDNVYRLLERPKKGKPTPIRDALIQLEGQFDEDFLDSEVLRDEWGWSNSALGMDRSLLLSFMLATGVCFPLRRSWETGISQAQAYLSPKHLPASAGEVSEIRNQEFSGIEETLVANSAMIHQGHWHALMRLIATQHGTEATIFRQAIKIAGSYYSQESNGKGSRREFRVLVEYEPVEYDQKGALVKPAKIFYRSTGLEEVQRKKLDNLLNSPLPDFMGNASAVVSEYRATVPEPPKAQEVFISYAWDYQAEQNRTEYARFVDELESRLLVPFPGFTKLVRDKNETKRGDFTPAFMDRIKRCKYAVVVLSDKYLTSWYCMYELDQLMDSLWDDRRGKSNVHFIIHPSIPPSLNPDDLTWRDSRAFWDRVLRALRISRGGSKSLRDSAQQVIDSETPNISRLESQTLHEVVQKGDDLTKACQPGLGINTLTGWQEFPVHFQSHILNLPVISQGLNMHSKLRYLENEPGKLDPDSITESIEEVIKWMHMREDQDRSRD